MGLPATRCYKEAAGFLTSARIKRVSEAYRWFEIRTKSMHESFCHTIRLYILRQARYTDARLERHFADRDHCVAVSSIPGELNYLERQSSTVIMQRYNHPNTRAGRRGPRTNRGNHRGACSDRFGTRTNQPCAPVHHETPILGCNETFPSLNPDAPPISASNFTPSLTYNVPPTRPPSPEAVLPLKADSPSSPQKGPLSSSHEDTQISRGTADRVLNAMVTRWNRYRLKANMELGSRSRYWNCPDVRDDCPAIDFTPSNDEDSGDEDDSADDERPLYTW